MKTHRIKVDLNQYEFDLWTEAAKVISHGKPIAERSDKDMVLKIGLTRFSVAIIRNGGITFPVAVDLRMETPDEKEDRIQQRIPRRGPLLIAGRRGRSGLRARRAVL